MIRLVVLFVLTVVSLAARAEAPVILIFGDSISAGFGLGARDQGWVTLLQDKVQSAGYGYRVVNASVSGETTAGGLVRLPRALSVQHPSIVVLELGGNDGLRALPVAAMRANLAQMASLARAAGAEVVLLGMRIPPNYGTVYTQQFHAVFSEVAREQHLQFVDFLLQGVALSADLMQADGVHPNGLGQPHLLQAVWPALLPLLRK